MAESGNRENRVRYFLRVLRPLFWWALLVLVLFGIRTHQLWMEKTRLNFNVSLEGRPFDADVRFDGKSAVSGQRISLGHHSFSVTHPKAEPFSTNLFIWYGGHDFGTIDLKRAKGTLIVTVVPPTSALSIEGPEFRAVFTNSSSFNNSVPTDDYTVTARYAHSEERRLITVIGNTTNPLKITPNFGVLQLTCNQNGATFQLLRPSGEMVETGDLPAILGELPEGAYQLVAWHHNHEWSEKPRVNAGATNDLRIEFEYGTAILETTPSGATVTTADGRERGVTPLTLTELQPGVWNFNFRLYNYEPAAVSLEIPANQTNAFHTNLTSQSYTASMRAARELMNADKYDQAAELLADALRVQPGDPAAAALQKQASGLGSITRAEALGKQGDYAAAIKELDKALATLPDSERAKQMLADFKRHEGEQMERARIERLNQGKRALDAVIAARYPDGDLFETHEIKTSKAIKDIELPLLNALKGDPWKFSVTKYNDASGLFEIEALQELSTVLATSAGRRQCVIVGAQSKDDETQILFKVLEYKVEAVNKFSIGAVIGAPSEVNYVPIHPSRVGPLTEKLQARINEGVSNVTVVVQEAIGTSSQ